MKPISRRFVATLAATILVAAVTPAPATAQSVDSALAATYKGIEAAFGKVPDFLKTFSKAGLPGAWAEVKALEFSDKTAIPLKYKSLIALAVAAQIPCTYCIWADTGNARKAGATGEEVAEAVAISALTRHWSTIFNGAAVAVT